MVSSASKTLPTVQKAGVSGLSAQTATVPNSYCATHARFRPYGAHPVGKRRDAAQILADMLLSDPSCRDHTTG
jgi:hypothetical protein